MSPPPTRNEQLALDELLNDIYRGIETLPDKQQQRYNNQSMHAVPANRNAILARSSYKEYELPASSPLVQQHKQDIAALRSSNNNNTNNNNNLQYYQANQPATSPQQPQRSTLKRQPTTSQNPNQQAQSLASFIATNNSSNRNPFNHSATPENRRRVRIVDHKDYNNTNQHYATSPLNSAGANANRHADKVKYINTNKLIYHEEKNPYNSEYIATDDYQQSDSDRENNNNNNDNNDNDNSQDDDDIDGVTRVEYYHTSWLDRQLGRASKRRSSKELNERQVKEKAVIEELKRSLKNGAITLRKSLRGKKHSKNKYLANDDQMLNHFDSSSSSNDRKKHSSVLTSGLATIPRKPAHISISSHKQQTNNTNNINKLVDNNSANNNNNNNSNYQSRYNVYPSYQLENTTKKDYANSSGNQSSQLNTIINYHHHHLEPTPKQITPTTHTLDKNSVNSSRVVQANHQYQQTAPQTSSYTSKTLPHNYNQKSNKSDHQLLQSHYRQPNQLFKNNTLSRGQSSAVSPLATTSNTYNTTSNSTSTSTSIGTTMRFPQSTQTKDRIIQPAPPHQTGHHYLNQQQQHQQANQPVASTISSIPSATEVVRSALSRSSSQTSVSQLNKTINLLAASPSPYPSSPMTPTQHLQPASPSLSPSPSVSLIQQHQQQHRNNANLCNTSANTQHLSKTLPAAHNRHPQALHGTRIIPATPTAGNTKHEPQYASPQMQSAKGFEQQQTPTTKPSAYHQPSAKEFNELDNLLRSLSSSSHGYHSTQITPGYTKNPTESSFGYGFNKAPNSGLNQQNYQQRPNLSSQDNSTIYAKIQKQPQPQPQSQQQPNKPFQAPLQQLNQNQNQQQQLRQHGVGFTPTQTHDRYTIDVTDPKDDNCEERQKLSRFEAPIEILPSMEDYQNISRLNPVKNHYWYKPNMTRERAISLLKDKPQGTFIVRDSNSFRGAYGLAVKVARLPPNAVRDPYGDPSNELIRHFLIEPATNGVRLKNYAIEPVFGSLPNLIYQHSLTELALPCKLIIPRADVEDPNFNQKQKQFFDEFLASKEQAKHSPYERTSPNGGYRKYPGDVYVHNEHRIIFE